MASMQDGVNFSAPPYSKVLLLGAIAAASAFVVTILIVVLCVGCHRKGKSHNGTGEERKHRLMDMNILRQSKLRSISKSDTKLHEMNRLNCNGKKSSKKNRPASMDLLLLPSRRSNSDLRTSQGRQVSQVPSGEDREHTYAEVGRRPSPTRCPEVVLRGRAGETDTPAPPAVPANTPAPPDPDGDSLDGGIPEPETLPQVLNPPPQPPETAEYACIRKVRKVDKAAQKRDNGTETEEGLGQAQRHSGGEIRHAPPSHPAPPPPHPHSQKLPRKNVEAFNLPFFPKEAVFIGNGEEYIWKPPEDDDIMFQPKHIGPLSPHMGENMAAGISDMYSKVCKPGKKKRGMPGSPTGPRDIGGYRTLARGERDGGFNVVVKPQTWAPQEAKGSRMPPGSMEEHCYEAIGVEESDMSFEAAEVGGGGGGGAAGWKRERPPPNASTTLRPKKRKPQQPQHQPPPPPPPPQHTPKMQHLPAKALLLPGENLYESIPDLKQGSTTSSTTTIFTFNDGMEMYVTGL